MDSITLIVGSLVTGFSATVVMAVVYLTRRTYHGFGTLLAGNGARLLAALLFLLPRESISAWLTIILPNYLLLAGLLLFLRGIRQFRHRRSDWRIEVTLSLLFIGLLYWFTYVDPNLNYRVIVLNLFSIGVLLALLWTQHSARPPWYGTADRILEAVWLMLLLASVVRIATTFRTSLPEDDTITNHADLNQWLLLMIFSALLIVLGQLMTNSQRLRYDLNATRQAAQRDLEERQRIEQRLRRSEERYRRLAEYTCDTIWTIDSAGQMAAVNAPQRLPIETPEPLQHYLQQTLNALATGADPVSFHTDLNYRSRDGSSAWYELVAYPLLDDDNRFVELLGVSRDISDHQQQLHELQQAHEATKIANHQLRLANSELQRRAETDPLTGCRNRRYLEMRLAAAMTQALSSEQPLALLLFDIDHFKQVNDIYGHLVGDAVLVELSQLLRETLRSRDQLARWGGEEFLLLITESDLEAATAIAERLRHLVAHHAFPSVGTITISLGVTCWQPPESLDHWLQRADEALYAAKRDGRNRVVAY